MKHIVACVSAVLFCMVSAQGQSTTKTGFYVIPQVGLLNGDKHVNAQVTLTCGVEYKGWGMGIGSGVDYYKIRSVPLVLDLRKNISLANRPVWVYMNAGGNIVAPLERQYSYSGSGWRPPNHRYINGWYGEAGIGYPFSKKTKRGFLLSFGFTSKTMAEHYTETVYSPVGIALSVHERRLKYSLNRVVLKLGYRL